MVPVEVRTPQTATETGLLAATDPEAVDAALAEDDRARALAYPGEPATVQPVHTVYVPADQAAPGVWQEWGRRALQLLDAPGMDGPDGRLARAAGLDRSLAEQVLPRVRRTLATRPVQDLRVDLEDGYGPRSEAEEDEAARSAGQVLAAAGAEPGGAPLLAGIRPKALEPATRRRSLRTLALTFAAAAQAGGLPARPVVTLAKATSVAQVQVVCGVLDRLEDALGLPAHTLRLELQVEVPSAVLTPQGLTGVSRMLHAAGRRCEGLHYGTYDFSAALGVSAGQQAGDHPLADAAKDVMQLAAAGTGVRVSDGSSNVLPVGAPAEVDAALAVHARLVHRALTRGLYQGWDLHPGQLLTRYAVTFGFWRRELAASGDRLRAYLSRSAGGVLDEPATAQALALAALRGLDCGAVDAEEVLAVTGASAVALERLRRRQA